MCVPSLKRPLRVPRREDNTWEVDIGDICQGPSGIDGTLMRRISLQGVHYNRAGRVKRSTVATQGSQE